MQALGIVREFKGKNEKVGLRELGEKLQGRGFDLHVVETNHHLGTRPISKGCLEQLRHTYIACEGFHGQVCSSLCPKDGLSETQAPMGTLLVLMHATCQSPGGFSIKLVINSVAKDEQ